MDKFPKYSGMEFVSEDAYPIEESASYQKLGNGVRSVEFVRIKEDKLFLVEARTTIANPNNSPEPYMAEVSEICEKFIHSLNLLSAIELGVVEEELPDAFVAETNVSLVFVLVVRNHKSEWCRPIKRQIEQLLPLYLKKIWKPTVYVVNHETATKYELTTA